MLESLRRVLAAERADDLRQGLVAVRRHDRRAEKLAQRIDEIAAPAAPEVLIRGEQLEGHTLPGIRDHGCAAQLLQPLRRAEETMLHVAREPFVEEAR